MSSALVIFLFIILAAEIIFLLVLASFGLTLFLGSPWVPTSPARARRMLEFAGCTAGQRVLDLGSGDGSILFSAVKDFGAAQAIGYEINPLLVWWSRFRSRLLGVAPFVIIRRKNIFTSSLPDVDIVTTFLVPSTMKKLRDKFAAELHPDTVIVSRGFEIPGAPPRQKYEGSHEWFYLYRAGDLLQ